MGSSSRTVLDLEDSLRTKGRGLGLGLEHSVLAHIPGHYYRYYLLYYYL